MKKAKENKWDSVPHPYFWLKTTQQDWPNPDQVVYVHRVQVSDEHGEISFKLGFSPKKEHLWKYSIVLKDLLWEASAAKWVIGDGWGFEDDDER